MGKSHTKLEPAEVGKQVLEIVRVLLRDGGRSDAAEAVTLHSNFEHDLGLASLELVELMVRCEARFEIELPDDIGESGDTPAAWVKAIIEGGQDTESKTAYHITPPRLDALSEPVSARSLLDVLASHAENDPGRVHIHLIEGDYGHGITYGHLYDDASAVAAGLADLGLGRNDTVAIMLPSSADFFSAFFGVMLAGGIPVPVYPPTRPDRIEDYVRQQIKVLRSAGVRFMISFERIQAVVQILRVNLPTLVDVTTVPELRKARGRLGMGSVRTSETAVLQFTSGSTGDPKAVALSHKAVLGSVRGIGRAVEIEPGDAVVSWLPLYSDLGLIGCWLLALYYGAPLTVVSPLDFLQRPDRWLRAIHDSRGTLSAAPNFAYDLCARRIPAWTLEGIDLSSWRVAVNAGEPVLQDTMDRFASRFGAYGFRPGALLPAYGLAEAGVALTMPPPGRRAVRDRIQREDFERRGLVIPAPPGDNSAIVFYSVGSPVSGQAIRLVDEQGNVVGERVLGRLQFRGPTSMSGYYRDAEATEAAVDAGGWIDSGDFGYMADGEFYFTGRGQEAIIKGGRNLSPLDVEAAVGLVAGVMPGSAVAFGAPEPGTGAERLVVAAETRATTFEDFRRIESEIIRLVDRNLGMPPDHIRLVEPGCLPRTQNGKVRRNEIRSLFLKRKLRSGRRSPWVQIVRLRWENLGALIGLGLRRGRIVTGRALTRWAAASVARIAGSWTRLTGSRRIVRSACKRILQLSAQRFVLQGDSFLEEEGAVVLIANRSGVYDPLAMVATLPGEVRFADQAALQDLSPALIYLLEPLVLGDKDGKKVPAAGAVRERVRGVLDHKCTVVTFPESEVGAPVSRSRYRLDAFRAAADAGAALHPVSVRERSAQQHSIERARERKVTKIIVRDSLPIGDDGDFFAVRERTRTAIGEYHA